LIAARNSFHAVPATPTLAASTLTPTPCVELTEIFLT